jgi:hypothetical protein
MGQRPANIPRLKEMLSKSGGRKPSRWLQTRHRAWLAEK